MPTTLQRTNITHVPRVQHILDVGRQLYPDASPAAILINLAEERVRELEPLAAVPAAPLRRNGLTMRTGRGVMTPDMVEDILNDD